jgi:hypothetical protein
MGAERVRTFLAFVVLTSPKPHGHRPAKTSRIGLPLPSAPTAVPPPRPGASGSPTGTCGSAALPARCQRSAGMGADQQPPRPQPAGSDAAAGTTLTLCSAHGGSAPAVSRYQPPEPVSRGPAAAAARGPSALEQSAGGLRPWRPDQGPAMAGTGGLEAPERMAAAGGERALATSLRPIVI